MRVNILLLFAFSSWPFCSFIAHNIKNGLSVGELFYFYISVLCLLGAGYFVLRMVTKKNSKSLHVMIFLSVAFFMFSLVEDAMNDFRIRYVFLVWSGLFCLALCLLWRLPDKKLPANLYIVILLSLYVVPLTTILKDKYSIDRHNYMVSSENIFPAITGINHNVYFFVLDGFSRADTLRKNFSHESLNFLSKLEANGFIVAENSFSNYPLTYLSISSTLSMKYLLPENATLTGRKPYYPSMQGNSETAGYFKSQGYKYIHIHPLGWTGTSCEPGFVDICMREKVESLQGAIYSNESVATMLRMTPVAKVLNLLYRYYEDMKEMGVIERSGLQHIEQITAAIDLFLTSKPFFIFAHVLTPHTPNTYGDSCEKVTDFESTLKSWSENYATQIRCSESDLLELVDMIIRLDKSNPIIVLQGDHGAASKGQFEKKFKDWNREDILERFGILNAILLPKKCRNLLYNYMTPVNTFRIVVACLSNQPVQLLPDISLFATYEDAPDYGLIKAMVRDGKLLKR